MATSSGVMCGVCDAQHVTKCAEYWCPECDEGLCSECHKYHSISKASRTHGCILINKYNKLPSSVTKINYYCQDHSDRFTNYCSHHDKLCCPVCMSTTHAECKGFLPIKEIIKTAKTSTLLDNMEQSLSDIENNIEKVIENREYNMSNIRQKRKKFHDDIKNLREKINSHLDSLEQKLIRELNDAEKKLQIKIEKIIDCVSKQRKSVHALRMNIQSLKEHASDLQTFICSKTYQLEVEEAEKYMKSLTDESLHTLDLKCRADGSILETLRTLTFGSVSIETGPPTLIIKTGKDKQAQIMAVLQKQSPKSINDIKLSLINTYTIQEVGTMGFLGCIVHPTGKLMLTDKSKSKLTVLNYDETVDMDIPCTSQVNDVTIIDETTVVTTTDNGINMINTDSNRAVKVIKTSHACYGTTYHKGKLLWCEESKGILRMDLSDTSLITLVKQDNLPGFSYVTTYEDNIYQTNFQTKTVTCYTIKGDKRWEYNNPQVLQDPVGITVDNNGNIYVTSDDSDDIVVISADGKEGKELLGQTDSILRPRGIYYDKNKDNLLIVNQMGPAFLFHVF